MATTKPPVNVTPESEELPIATLAGILGISVDTTEYVPVPKWGVRVGVRAVSKAAQFRIRKAATVKGKVDEGRMEAMLLAEGIVEPKIPRDQIDRLLEKDMGSVDTILTHIYEMSGMSADALDEAEADYQD
jgi:hypothetical protein